MKKITKTFYPVILAATFSFFLQSCASTNNMSTSIDNSNLENSYTDSDRNAEITSSENALFSVAGEKIECNGWFDNSKLSYPTAKKIVIDDKTYPTAKSKMEAFTKAINSTGEKFIILDGEIDLSQGKISDNDHSYFDEFNSDGTRSHGDLVFNVSSNTTIIGTRTAKIKFGGLLVKNVKNVIIRNIEFYDVHGSTEKNTKIDEKSKASIDAINIEDSNNVWIDHCTFSDGKCDDLVRNFNHDGLVDIKKGLNITVSYCEFFNHDKVMLVRPGDTYTNPDECLVTLHHNYFHDAIQRMPRSRGVKMHIYNNYFENIGNSKNSGNSLGPGIGSLYVVENNYFGKHANTIVKYYDKSAKGDSTFSKFYQSGNIPELKEQNCAFDKVDKTKSFSSHLVSQKPFEISYTYTLDSANSLKEEIIKNAGAGKEMNFSR